MNAVIENMISRRSVKNYDGRSVPEELLEEIVKAGTYAPSGRNRQAAIIIAVTDKKLRDKLSQMNATVLGTASDPFYGAPAVLVVLSRRDVSTHVYDGSVVMENMMLAAHSLGLGACWIHRAREVFDSEEGKAILKDLGISGEYEGIGHCVVGYPATAETREPLPRKEGYVIWVK